MLKDQKGMVNTAYIHSVSAHRQFRKFDELLKQASEEKKIIANYEDVIRRESDIVGQAGDMQLSRQLTEKKCEQVQDVFIRKKTEKLLKEGKDSDLASYKFLIQKQYEKIKSRDKQTRLQHK